MTLCEKAGWFIGYLLVGSALSSLVAVVWLAQASIGVESPNFYTLIAASFGIIIAIWSGWTSFRVAKQAEKDRQPYPFPEIDLRSRPGLYLLRVTNYGISAAKNIVIEWDKGESPKHKDGTAPFPGKAGTSYIPVIGPGQSVAALLGSVLDKERTFQGQWEGKIKFETTLGRRCEEPFIVGDSQYKKALWYDTEPARLMAALLRFLDRKTKKEKC